MTLNFFYHICDIHISLAWRTLSTAYVWKTEDSLYTLALSFCPMVSDPGASQDAVLIVESPHQSKIYMLQEGV